MVVAERLRSNNNTVMARKGLPNLLFSSSKSLSPTTSSLSSSIPPSPNHTFSESMVQESIENAESVITKWDINSSSITKVTSLFHHDRKEAKQFLRTVKDLRQAMHFLLSERSASNKLVLAQNLMQMAMKRLEKEFYEILSANLDQLDPESVSGQSSEGSSNFEDDDEAGPEEEIERVGDSITKVEKVPAPAMSDLKSIADCMISAGYGTECIKIYKIIRKSIVDEGLYLLGIERFRSSQVQKLNCEALERMIKNWLNAVKTAVRTLFAGEKVLCDHVFSASQRTRESCFSEITKEAATNLFRFPELVAKSKKWPEKIFSLMKLYEALSDLLPEIETIFNAGLTSAIIAQARSSLLRLGESVRVVLSDFESTIQKDSSKTLTSGAGIHPLTQTAMDYISSLADYSGILSDIIADSPPQSSTPLPESYFESPTSSDASPSGVSVYLAWLILVLLCKLDSKAGLYKDISLSYLFLANNLQFIVEKVHTTRLKFLLGEDWVLTHARKVRQYASNYETIAWRKVFSTLPEKTSPESSPESAKENFRRFNAAFEEAYRKQTSLIVPDRKLRDELKVSIARQLVPAYKEFYDTYNVMLTEEKNLEVLVRFAPDNLENYLSDMFLGAAISGRSSSSSSSRGCMPR